MLQPVMRACAVLALCATPVAFAAPKPVGPGEKATAPFLTLAQPE